MSQKLILPINACAFSAGYKNAAYLKQQGYTHYGVDLYSTDGDQTVRAIGDGTVIAAGLDGGNAEDKLGRCCVIVYPDVELHDGSVKSLACRMFHFDSINVKAGQTVKQGDIIGNYGNTGSTLVLGKKMGKHLHIEFDTDVQYPQYAVGIKEGGYIIRKGTVDSTVDPSNVWYLAAGQSVKGIYAGWYKDGDIDLPKIETEKEDDSAAVPIAWDEEEYESYWGVPVWIVRDGDVKKLFDRWWRKVPTYDSPEAGRYAREDEVKAAAAYDDDKLHLWYDDPNDADGKAGMSDTDEGLEQQILNELVSMRKAVTEYELLIAQVHNLALKIVDITGGT